MSGPKGFKEIKKAVIAALKSGDYQHEARGDINVKNRLATGELAASDVVAIIKRSNGLNHSSSPHHSDSSIEVHVIKSGTWYVKFYFIDPVTWFISVHQ